MGSSPSIPRQEPHVYGREGRAYREGLLLLGDVGVAVTPVVQKLLLLAVIDPHDLSGRGLDDVLQLPQVIHPLEGRFLHSKFKSSVRVTAGTLMGFSADSRDWSVWSLSPKNNLIN